MNAEKFKLGDLPLDLLEEAFREIKDYFTAFIIDNKLAGSGTFAKLDGVPGILTARHVWDHVKQLAQKDPQVGIMVTEKAHRFSIHVNNLVPTLNIQRLTDTFGPDLEFIKLPAADVGTINARKSFYELGANTATKLAKARDSYGICVVMGAPAENVIQKQNPLTKVRQTTVHVRGMILQRNSPKMKSGYDYWEMKTLSAVEGRPEDFGGVSGGGVWRLILAKKRNQPMCALKVTGCYLGGVAFYQSALKNGFRFLRSHGPISIYRCVPELFARNRQGMSL